MKRPISQRRWGAFDSTDLVVGIVVAIAIPIVARVFIGMVGPKTRSDLGAFQERVEIAVPAPDAEEVNARLAYCRRLYTENALGFLSRAREVKGVRQKDELVWARTALDAVKREATNLRFLIKSTESGTRFSSALKELEEIESAVDRGLQEVKELDLIGVLK